jgi:carboxylesterase
VANSLELPLIDSSAFDLPGGGRAAALCLHGLTGTPYEVRSLGVAFAASGIRAFGPALPGHNETPERLARGVFAR